jgi:hypothetical protein
MRFLLILIGVLGFALPAIAAGTLSEGDFTQAMLKQFREAYPQAKIMAGERLTLDVTLPGEDVRQVFLHRVFEYCGNNPSECDQARADLVASLVDKVMPLTRDSLRVVVRDSEYVESVRRMELNSDRLAQRFAVRRQIGDNLYIILASDSPRAIAMVGDSGLKDLGLTEDQAFDLAMRQTKAVLPALPGPHKLREASIAFSGEEYTGSIVADTKAWASIAEVTGGTLLVAVISDQLVMIMHVPDGPKIDELAKVAAESCRAAPRCISPSLYRFRDGGWRIAR